MPDPVIITRPEQQGQALVDRLTQSGRQAILFPLLRILPLEDESLLRARLSRLTDYALVSFVSPNAIAASLRHVARWPAGVDIAVVGEGSRQALADHGITDAVTRIYSPRNRERSDSQTLLEVLDLPALAGRKVLLLRGESGRELLADALRAAGAQVEAVAAYRRLAPEFDAERRQQLHELLSRQATWVITSSEALRNLLAMAAASGDEAQRARLLQQELLVPHVRIEETARELGFARVVRCASGDDALIATLELS